ncbi:Na+-driven multidrug efflux pump [Fibrobacter sp. UWB16]|uniref:lipopolysaccharide biosynthesis protein n=1 Tax=Fibrobacter sp. UWB16 TaxID=1945874 RepID=UPI000BCC1F2A|nr:hypothetical protein [Fibrobacter sp. UWB16]SOD11537.1 Na+-driven multidrug efflux pump [Fibrobacter sp. UWB16]
MPEYKTSASQITKNALFLYCRQIIIMAVGLLTVRITLSILGIVDYGVNNVVAGTVSMFAFLSGSLASGSQRFFSFYIGSGEKDKLSDSFKGTFSIYVIFTLIIFVLQEIVGLWLLNNKLVIPPDRMFAAQCIFQMAILGSCASLMTAPYMASVIAHENMKVFAQVGIIEVVLKLLIVFLLYISPADKLITYGFLYMLINLGMMLFYQMYTFKKYDECRSSFLWRKDLIKELLSFNGWNCFGSFAWMMKNQGLSIMLNTFFGPIVNAAQQIGTQIRSISASFSQNFSMATKPQIIKSYAAKDYDRTLDLVFKTAKINFFLMYVITLPACFSLDYLLDLWLVDVPQYAVVICQLLLIENLVETSSLPFAVVNQATGKIALYQFLIGVVGLLNIPFAYIACCNGCEPKIAFLIGVILQLCIAAIRIIFVQRVFPKSFFKIIGQIYIPCSLIVVISYFTSHLLWIPITSFMVFTIETLCQVLLVLLLSYFIGLNKNERVFCISLVKKKLKKV